MQLLIRDVPVLADAVGAIAPTALLPPSVRHPISNAKG